MAIFVVAIFPPRHAVILRKPKLHRFEGKGAFIDDVFEKPLPAARLSERAALQYAVHLFANGLLVGFAPAIERNDRHALTPNAMKKAGPGCIGVGCIQYYTMIKRQSLSLWAPEIAA